MKIFLRDIPEEGLNIDKTFAGEDIGLSDAMFKCLTPLHLKARVERAQDAVLAKAEVEAGYEFSCGRCLEPVRQQRADQFDLYFEITPDTEFIDLTEDIRQELLIVLTGIMLCEEDCRGLCPHCGVNLNARTCRCQAEQPESDGILSRPGKGFNIK